MYAVAGVRENGDSHPRTVKEICWCDRIPSRWRFWCESGCRCAGRVGRRVWNRQRTGFDLADPANTSLGHRQVQRWNLPEGWVISKHPAHTALVSKGNFITAQDMAVPRGPAGPAVRRYLLAGLLACGRCERRLESAWSNGKPAYRCRHGYTSAASASGRPGNTYVREDQILPHLAAIGIILAASAGNTGGGNRGPAQVTGPADAAALIDQLRSGGIVLTYHPDDRTLHAADDDARRASPSATTNDTRTREGGPLRQER
jgi:site-specific DNA recombinase